ncbi:hypothetical protein RJT34_15731 [Clitoria ternatea]|uniref:Tify domain-containing protein n=1 Tax=Clitoria ternatea TaxID=43366 RepID=A0AAN9J7D1_CLITE
MAKGTDFDEFVLLFHVRTSLKREFTFAMKAQSEIYSCSLGQTRSSKNCSDDILVQTSPTSKQSKPLDDKTPRRFTQSTRKPRDGGFKGVIKDYSVLCFCKKCKGVGVLVPNVFELHAGNANKQPLEYIYLKNGSSLRDLKTSLVIWYTYQHLC